MDDKKEFLKNYNTEEKNDYDKQKNQTEKIELYYQNSTLKDYKKHARLAERMSECAKILRFYVNDNNVLELKNANYCRCRLCPICQLRRSKKYRAIAFQKFPRIVKNNPNLSYIFLTLTVKNCEIQSLKNEIDKMNYGWSKLRKLKFFKDNFQGFIKATEVTKGKNNTAHPHFHILLATKRAYFSRGYIKTDKWAEIWGEVLKLEYVPVVDVRKVKLTQDKNNITEKAVLEILKYTTKPTDMIGDGSALSRDWFLQLSDQLFKLRFISTGGIFKNIFVEEQEECEPLELEEMEEELKKSLYFGWKTEIKKYKKIKV